MPLGAIGTTAPLQVGISAGLDFTLARPALSSQPSGMRNVSQAGVWLFSPAG